MALLRVAVLSLLLPSVILAVWLGLAFCRKMWRSACARPDRSIFHSGTHLALLVAPYCAILRDYLSDTPLLRAMGFFVSQHGQLGAIPPPPFLSISPVESIRSGGAMPPPPKRGISKANGCDTPLCDTISKRYCAIGGGVSRTGPLS